MTQPPAPDRESLQVLLAKVHERLSEAGSVDTGSRELLGQVMGDIERALKQGSGVAGSTGAIGAGGRVATGSAAAAAHTPRLEALAVKFEADHPALAASVRRLVDLLGNAGI